MTASRATYRVPLAVACIAAGALLLHFCGGDEVVVTRKVYRAVPIRRAQVQEASDCKPACKYPRECVSGTCTLPAAAADAGAPQLGGGLLQVYDPGHLRPGERPELPASDAPEL